MATRRTRFDRFIDDITAQTVPLTLRVTVEKFAEAYVEEFLRHEATRRSIQDAVRRHSPALLDRLAAPAPPRRARKTRG